MAGKSKVNWWDTFNPFAHKAAADKTKAAAKKKRKVKTKPIDWTKRVKEQETAKKAKNTKVAPKKAGVKVVKPRSKDQRKSY